jgi:hypothetical protein
MSSLGLKYNIHNDELHMVAKSMVMNKMLGWMAIEFYTFFWYFIGENFHKQSKMGVSPTW